MSIDRYSLGVSQCTDEQETTHNWGAQSKAVFKICEEIWCSSFHVKEFDVIVHKDYFLI